MRLFGFRFRKRAQVQKVIVWILGLAILVAAIISVVKIVAKYGG